MFLDEICGIEEWSRELMHFANKGAFINCSLLVTGSHAMDLKHSTELMPGRRGGAGDEPLDKILLPMKFSEFVRLVWPEFAGKMFDFNIAKSAERHRKIMGLLGGVLDPEMQNLMLYKKQLDALLETYLVTGGIPATINEYMDQGTIHAGIFNIYLTSIIGDLNRYGYKESYLKQLVREIFPALSNPVSWNSFTKSTEIKSHNTVQDYATALEELYVLNLTYRCSIHDQRIHAYRKKLYITDPFIFHALHGWAGAKPDLFTNAKANVLDLEVKSKLIESVVHNHLCRLAYGLSPRDLFDPKDRICYYEDQSGKEIDFVLLHDAKPYPFEVKYQASISDADFAGFRSFNKGVLITRDEWGTYRQYAKVPVSIFLLLI